MRKRRPIDSPPATYGVVTLGDASCPAEGAPLSDSAPAAERAVSLGSPAAAVSARPGAGALLEVAPPRDFRLPRYRDIPDVGLYLEQVVAYVNGILAPLGIPPLTPSMVSNYVKQGIIPAPVKKRYGSEQLACLLFVACAKTALSMEDIGLFLGLQRVTYDIAVAYDYFCDQLEAAVACVFGQADAIPDTGVTSSTAKTMLRYCVIAVANIAFLARGFQAVRDAEGVDGEGC